MILTSAADIKIPWLQRVVGSPSLTSLTAEESRSTHAYNAILRLQTEGEPKSLFLKCCRGGESLIAESEVLYYTQDYATLADAPIPRCYASGFDRATGDYFLLLEDLSATHYSNKDVPPTLEHALTVATELARIHAHHWGDANGSTDQVARFLKKSERGLRFLGETAIEILARHPGFLHEHAQHSRAQTRLHGDANPSNVLSPRGQGKTYLIDRQPFEWSIRNYLGVLDLAYMAVPFWDPADRRVVERPMLERYHFALGEFGVRGYSWQECEADYRACLPYGFFVAAGWEGEEGMRWLWEKQLSRTLSALADWS